MRAARRNRFTWIRVIGLLLPSLVTLACGPETYDCRFLVSWSPDGSHAAAVPNLLEDLPDSGIWVFDALSGQSRQILELRDGRYGIHPQWSPYSNEILFATLTKEEEGTKDPVDNRMRFSVWVIGADGYGLRRIADSVSIDTSGDSDIPRIGLPNTVAWGAEPGTVIFQKAVGDRVTAVFFDPYTGRTTEFLPHPADGYSLEPAPSRRKVAALLYDKHSGLAEVFLSDFGFGNWRRLATIGYDRDQLDAFSAMIYWSPDSSCFVVLEEEHGPQLEEKSQYSMRLFDAGTGQSWRVADGRPNTAIIWDSDSRYFFFSGTANENDDSDSTVNRVDSRTGGSVPHAIIGGDNFLISWNHADRRVYFYNRLAVKGPGSSEETAVRRYFSCQPDGSDVRDLGPWVENDEIIWSTSPDGTKFIYVNPMPRMIGLFNCGFRIADCGLDSSRCCR